MIKGEMTTASDIGESWMRCQVGEGELYPDRMLADGETREELER